MRIEVPSPSGSCPPTPPLGRSLSDCSSEDAAAAYQYMYGTPYPSSSSSSSSAESRIRPMGTVKEQRGEVEPLKFKTQLCGYYVRGEACPYAPWCAFAHGEEEKRSVKSNVDQGIRAVNTLPRTMVFHEVWVQTTKYTRKTGPSTSQERAATQAPPPRPSFMRKAATPEQPAPQAVARPPGRHQHNPYGQAPSYMSQ